MATTNDQQQYKFIYFFVGVAAVSNLFSMCVAHKKPDRNEIEKKNTMK